MRHHASCSVGAPPTCCHKIVAPDRNVKDIVLKSTEVVRPFPLAPDNAKNRQIVPRHVRRGWSSLFDRSSFADRNARHERIAKDARRSTQCRRNDEFRMTKLRRMTASFGIILRSQTDTACEQFGLFVLRHSSFLSPWVFCHSSLRPQQ